MHSEHFSSKHPSFIHSTASTGFFPASNTHTAPVKTLLCPKRSHFKSWSQVSICHLSDSREDSLSGGRRKSTEVICSAISEREATAPRERCFSDSRKQALIILKRPRTCVRTHRRCRGEDRTMTAETKVSKQTEESCEIIRAVKPSLRRRDPNSVAASESLKTSSVCVGQPLPGRPTELCSCLGRDGGEEGLKERLLSGKGWNK